jgi:hypothetical protein
LQFHEQREFADIRALEKKHDEEGEQLRVQWLFELRKWAADVALVRRHLFRNLKVPDAPWLAG